MDKLKQKATINVDGKEISVLHFGGENDYISLTDIAKFRNPDDAFIVINNWMPSKDTILFLGLWEHLNNPDLKPTEFDRFKREAGANAFTLSPQKWVAATNATAAVLNMALFGKTSKKRREENPGAKGNIRDLAAYQQLIVLVNLESMNAELIKMGLSQNERALRLNKMAIEQMSALVKYNTAAKQIEGK
jgi:hypothetical protein